MAKDTVLKYPSGFRGIMKTTTNESEQEEVFFPCDGRLIAVNFAGDPDMGSVVCDLDDNFEIDPDRVARLHSLMRVVKYPFGANNGLALQLGPSGQEDTAGYFIDRRQAGDRTKMAVAQGSRFENGPFHCGTGQCKHRRGYDDDGNPISPLHFWTSSLFWRNDKEDGPLRFETEFQEGQVLDHPVKVTLGWTGGDWAWWTTSPCYPIEPTPGTPTRPTGPSPFVPTSPTTTTGLTQIARIPIGAPHVPRIADTSITNSAMRFLAALSPFLAPAMMFRPQNYGVGQVDTGMFTKPTEEGKSKADNAPVVGGCSAFGAQGGEYPTYGDNPHTGASGDPWNYTQAPRGSTMGGGRMSKYLGGTANGGIVFHPAETDLRDADDGMAPDNITLSTFYVLTAPNAWFGSGVPELTRARIIDGYSWGMDSTTGDLLFRSHTDGAAPSTAMRFSKTAQNISWRSGTLFWGELEHANTADRVYTFPDASGTIPLGTGTLNQVAVWSGTNTLIGDSGLTFVPASDLLTVTGAGGGVQLRLAYDGSNYVELRATSTGDITLVPTGDEFSLVKAQVGSVLVARVENTDNTNAASDALLQTLVGGTSAGDPYFRAAISAGTNWAWGLDNSDSDKFKISQSDTPGTNDFLTITTAGRVGFALGEGNAKIESRNTSGETGALTLVTNDYVLNTTGSKFLIAFGAASGNTYTSLNATDIGGNSVANLILQDSGGSVLVGSATDFNGRPLQIRTAVPGWSIYQTDAGADEKGWDFLANLAVLEFRCLNDANTLAGSIMRVARVAQNPSIVIFNEDGVDCDFRVESDNQTHALFVDAGTDRVGFFTGGPDRRVDILDASGDPQLRLTYTDGTVYGEFEADSSGNILVLCTGNNFAVFTNTAGATITNRAEHNDNTNGASHARLIALTGGASGGDPATLYTVNGVSDFIHGIDNSDSDRYKICSGNTIGTNDALTITSALSVVLNNAALATTATDGFLYVAGCAGTPTGVPTSFTGRAPIVIDTTNNKLYFYSGGAWRDAGP